MADLREKLETQIKNARLNGFHIKTIEINDPDFCELIQDPVITSTLNVIALTEGIDTRVYGHFKWDGVNIVHEGMEKQDTNSPTPTTAVYPSRSSGTTAPPRSCAKASGRTSKAAPTSGRWSERASDMAGPIKSVAAIVDITGLCMCIAVAVHNYVVDDYASVSAVLLVAILLIVNMLALITDD